jgi:hypothetical protein
MAHIRYFTFPQAQAYYHDQEEPDVEVDISNPDTDELAALPTHLRDNQNANVHICRSDYDNETHNPVPNYAAALAPCGNQITTLTLCALPLNEEFWNNLPLWCPRLKRIHITDMDPTPQHIASLVHCLHLETVGLNRSDATALHFEALAHAPSLNSVCLIDNELLTPNDINTIRAIDTHVLCILDDDTFTAPTPPRHRPDGAPAFGLTPDQATRLGLYPGIQAGQ